MLGLALDRQFRKVSRAAYAVVRRRCAHSSETKERLEGGHGLPSAIVPKNELVQIDLQLGAANPMVSTEEPLLEVPDGAISEGHHGFRSLVQLGSQGLSARDMLEDFVQTREGFKAIGEDRRTGNNVLGEKVVDRCRLEVGDDRHADAPRGCPALLHGGQDECGSAPLELSAASDTGLDTAHPRVVDLDRTPKRFASDIHHRSSELVKHHPGGLVTPKPKLALEKQCRNTPLVGGYQVGCPEPKGQGGLGIVKHGPRGERDLVAAGGTLPEPSPHQRIAASVGASRTLVTLGPAARGQVLLAGLLVGKLELKLAESLREGWTRHAPTLQLVVT